MKKIFPFAFLLLCLNCFSQQKKSALKINLSGIVIRNLSVQYEIAVAPKTSVALAVRNIPYGKLPFSSAISNLVDNNFVDFDKTKVGMFGIIPEVRFYLGKKNALQGFYLGIFGNYSNYNNLVPIAYNNKTGLFNGKVKTYTGGLQLGAQFKLSESFFIDWWILGPNYGSGSGDLVFAGSLTAAEQTVLRDNLEQLKKDVPFNFIKAYNVDANGAYINVKGPWAGLRGLGINVAYHF